ncbi:MAG: F0F1 ATP synthase subunit gamma [Alphaproteobacteria bacterium]|jgi:F-type H+-transporting ATPase subunit gamma|nr:F0F1 ATP synthase subunit gamma [Alphaproteobacteria bacterium]MBT4085368.1 F0F1 ATP synthase subunit gamma [Alphaproteobacteria bacterium]MBT4546016.1 F0F1 ATP synthase subunit gamma [Alphaproteobacteria bacterium]MBT7744067.1 F0F1 ATP synthase subunit gamma [Alphaproteobacteria bacterium]
MASLKDLKNRISSVRSTQKITKAMQMVAASKLRRAQEQAEAARPYSERMERMMGALTANLMSADDAPKLMVGTGKDDVHLLIVATSERGLCGGFNSSIVRAARVKVASLLSNGKTVKIMCVGKKGADALKRNYSQYFVDGPDMSAIKKLTFADAHPVSESINTMFEAGEFDVCTVFYNKFVTVMEQVVTEQQLVPLPIQEVSAEASAEASEMAYEFEPEEDEILAEVLPRNMAVQVYRALLENAASEQGARMSAMDNATRNAGDMIDKLNIVYNRTRQAKITSELIEIISGAEAV